MSDAADQIDAESACRTGVSKWNPFPQVGRSYRSNSVSRFTNVSNVVHELFPLPDSVHRECCPHKLLKPLRGRISTKVAQSQRGFVTLLASLFLALKGQTATLYHPKPAHRQILGTAGRDLVTFLHRRVKKVTLRCVFSRLERRKP